MATNNYSQISFNISVRQVGTLWQFGHTSYVTYAESDTMASNWLAGFELEAQGRSSLLISGFPDNFLQQHKHVYLRRHHPP